jgi:hypothetical protein
MAIEEFLFQQFVQQIFVKVGKNLDKRNSTNNKSMELKLETESLGNS